MEKKVSINEWFKSLASFSWAMSLFAVKQLANTVSPNRCDKEKNWAVDATAAFNVVTRATEEEFNKPLKSAFQAGDQLQAVLVDTVYSSFRLNVFTSRNANRLFFELLMQSAEAFRLLMPGDENRAAWQEFRNKVQAYSLFEYVDELLPPAGEQSLARMIESAAALDPFCSVWAMEGVGHYYTEQAWMLKKTPDHLLNNEHAVNLPEYSLIPLHAGMGLSLAIRALTEIGQEAGTNEMRRVLERFVMLCQTNSRDGYQAVAYEALGLAARSLYPELIAQIERLLVEINEELTEYFWHGVGRAVYFSPTNLALYNGSWHEAIEKVRRESPHALARKNVTAGFAWAAALVNIRHPQLLEIILQSAFRRQLDEDACTDGVSSALIVWRDVVPHDRALADFYNYQPSAADYESAAIWNRLAREAFVQAQRSYDALKARNSFGELFRYRSSRRRLG